jgi:LmbE family N-acetylglucosaminyl deacetylase
MPVFSPDAAGPTIFLSPHYDVVVLSCGGLAARLAMEGHPPLMVTIFASEIVDEMVGDFAAWKHSRWGVATADEVLDVRRAEDAAAAAVLGCPVRWLGLPDAIYRGERYTTDSELFGALHEDEYALAAHLAEEVRQLPEWVPGTRVYVPLGAGNHVDHQLTFEVGRALAALGESVFAYEDCPYAIHTPDGVTRRLEAVGDAVGEPVIVPIAKTLDRRIGAIAEYKTQVPVIFRFTQDFASAITAHAERVGGSLGPAERYWPVLGRKEHP